MKAEATIRLKFPTKKQLDTAIKSLQPEIKTPATTRSKATLMKEDTFLVLKVEARDTVALRSTLNSYLRWIDSMLTVFQVVEKQ